MNVSLPELYFENLDMTSIKKVNKFKTAADALLDNLAELIETRIRTGNYDLDPQ